MKILTAYSEIQHAMRTRRMRYKDLENVTGLTRQRIHQILTGADAPASTISDLVSAMGTWAHGLSFDEPLAPKHTAALPPTAASLTDEQIQGVADMFETRPDLFRAEMARFEESARAWVKRDDELRRTIEKLNYAAAPSSNDHNRSGRYRANLLHGFFEVHRTRPTDPVPYRFSVGDTKVLTSIHTFPKWTGLAGTSFLTKPERHDPGLPEPSIFRPFAAEVAQRLGLRRSELFNNTLYRLLSVSGDGHGPLTFTFSTRMFFEYRFTSGLLEDELSDYILDNPGLDVPKGSLKLRRRFIPDRATLVDFDRRFCAGGLGLLLAFQTKDSDGKDAYLMFIHRRSGKVSDTRYLLAPVPKGFHQPLVGLDQETDILRTCKRELYEEVFAGKDAKWAQGMAHDFYEEKKVCPAMHWLREHPRDCDWETTAFGINAVGGNYEFANLLCVHNPEFFGRFADEMRLHECDEFEPLGAGGTLKDVHGIYTTDTATIKRYLLRTDWANEGLFHFVEGLKALQALAQKRDRSEMVKLPDLEVVWD